MPTYEYECAKCGKVFELFQPITAKRKTRVPAKDKGCDCDSPVTRRIGCGGGIIFKGSGFYQTDYRSEGYKKAQKAEKEAVEGKTKDDKNKKKSKPDKKDSSKAVSDSASSST